MEYIEKNINILELKEFALSQPDDREVRMNEDKSSDPCGCLMVHFAKDVLNFSGEFTCATCLIHGEDGMVCLSDSIFSLIPNNWENIKNYGDLKKYMKS